MNHKLSPLATVLLASSLVAFGCSSNSSPPSGGTGGRTGTGGSAPGGSGSGGSGSGGSVSSGTGGSAGGGGSSAGGNAGGGGSSGAGGSGSGGSGSGGSGSGGSAGDASSGDASAGDVALEKINILAIGEVTENGRPEIHAPFVMAAKPWLTQLAQETGATVTFVESPNMMTDATLANVDLILQLNYKPFGWNATAKAAFEKYMTEGRGGWVGLHHAGLYGPAVTQETWPWFFNFLGQINYRNYISTFVKATVRVEDMASPLFKGVSASFEVPMEEWYTWDKSPRPNVKVLATVDETTYMPNSTIKMGGDHPVVWSNDKVKGRNVYIFMGHSPALFQNTAWVQLFRNAIFWAGAPTN